MTSIFDLFSSKKNLENIRDNISKTIDDEFHQKIGLRYDPLIESKVKEVMSRVSEKVPDGKSPKEYIMMMNKKVISLVLPTVRANALKDKPKQEVIRKRVYDDPQDLLKRRDGDDHGVREQFNLPLEDMSQRIIPDHPRPHLQQSQQNRFESDKTIYQQFSNQRNDMNIPKFQEDLPDKRHGETLAMFNQLRSVYEEERFKAGLPAEEPEPKPKVQVQAQLQEELPKKKIVIRKNRMETPIESDGEKEKEKVKELLTFPQVPIQYQPSSQQSQKRRIQLYCSSNYRNFTYHKSPSSIRIYLTPYFDKEDDPFVYFRLPEFVDKYGNKLYNAFEMKNPMDHHLSIPNLKNMSNIQIDRVQIYKKGFQDEHRYIYVEILPKSDGDNDDNNNVNVMNHYHNESYLKRELCVYDPKYGYYTSPFQNELSGSGSMNINVKKILQNGYLQFNLYDSYQDYIHYEEDIHFINRIEKCDSSIVKLYIPKEKEKEKNQNQNQNHTYKSSSLLKKGEKIYLYSLLHENPRFIEFGDTVFGESFDKISTTQFRLCAINVIDDEKNYKIDFQEVLNGSRELLEDDAHKSISHLFYFVISQLKDGKRMLYYCTIDYIDELGNIILSHPNGSSIVDNFENTEQFGFIHKNYNGMQYNDSSSLFRKRGYKIEECNEDDAHMIVSIICEDQSFSEYEGFLRFHECEINLQFSIEF